MPKFNYDNALFDYEPYPICYVPNFLTEEEYKELADSYPDLSLFKFMESLGNKYALAEIHNKENYYKFLEQNPAWNKFFKKVKSKEFVEEILQFLKQHNIDLGLKNFAYTPDVNANRRKFKIFRRGKTIRSRFEFAVMPASGGHILPHTDARQKLITLVVSFVKPGEWKKEWGGGTAVVLPKDRTKIYNELNKQGKFEDVEIIKEFPFNPNQMILFIKTYNSWHSVDKMTGPEDGLRKTLTINIERIA